MPMPASVEASPLRPVADLDACVALMRTGSRTFFAASRLLPLRVRASSIALYAFCRVADDLVDCGGMAVGDAMAVLSHRLDRIYEGLPLDHVEDRALAVVVQRHQLPRALLDALLDGFAWDAQGRSYDSLEDLHDYGARVAGSVGAMMCWIMGVRSPQALARACELGVAMQLTNILRDVKEDFDKDRIYLPADELRRFGLSEADLGAGRIDECWRRFMKFQIERARKYYRSGESGIPLLAPDGSRLAVALMSAVYAGILDEIERADYDVFKGRVHVSFARKLGLAARAFLKCRALEHRTR